MTDSLLSDAVGEILAEVCTDDARRAAERDGFAPEIWLAVAEAGPAMDLGPRGGRRRGRRPRRRPRGAPAPPATTACRCHWRKRASWPAGCFATSGLRPPASPTTVAVRP